MWALVGAAWLFVSLSACSSGEPERPDILVLAAASLADVLAEVEREYERGGNGQVSFSYGGSLSLARQIAGGAPADVFVSAGGYPMNELSAEGLIAGEPKELFGNALVVATRSPELTSESLSELVGRRGVRIAVADPELAPAGRYAKQALESMGMWDPSGGSLVFAPDVRAALTYVQSGDVDAAIVYQTDAEAAQGVRALDIVPADSYERIVYPAAVVGRSAHQGLAARFVEFLRGPEAQAIFRGHGFGPIAR